MTNIKIKRNDIIASAWGYGVTNTYLVRFNGGSEDDAFSAYGGRVQAIEINEEEKSFLEYELKRLALNRFAKTPELCNLKHKFE